MKPRQKADAFTGSFRRVMCANEFDIEAGTIENRQFFVYISDEPGSVMI
ncbi:MAG: hypothetical protein IMY80_03765 [Chloroflexi bacterium]|nr:hypothetical protein [Chloroflexota bacterium]